jgi:hypothetical protein
MLRKMKYTPTRRRRANRSEYGRTWSSFLTPTSAHAIGTLWSRANASTHALYLVVRWISTSFVMGAMRCTSRQVVSRIPSPLLDLVIVVC